MIDSIAQGLFSRVSDGSLSNLPFEDFAREIAVLYNDINFLHPFREGNGRTQRVYFTQLIRNCGYDIDFSNVDTDYLMIATIQAAAGVLDHLVEFFLESIKTV